MATSRTGRFPYWLRQHETRGPHYKDVEYPAWRSLTNVGRFAATGTGQPARRRSEK